MELALGLEITLIGMGVVFATLVVLMGVVQIPLLVVNMFNARKQRPESAAALESQSQAAGIPPQHVAVIAAAVSMMGESYRIRTIEFAGNDNWERSRYTEITTL